MTKVFGPALVTYEADGIRPLSSPYFIISSQCSCGFEQFRKVLTAPRTRQILLARIVQIGMDSGFSGRGCGKPA
jgi:hypothetical protein